MLNGGAIERTDQHFQKPCLRCPLPLAYFFQCPDDTHNYSNELRALGNFTRLPSKVATANRYQYYTEHNHRRRQYEFHSLLLLCALFPTQTALGAEKKSGVPSTFMSCLRHDQAPCEKHE